jgi:hypothetical protein
MTATMTTAEMLTRIGHLEKTADESIGNDEGTSDGRTTFEIFERIDGSRYAIKTAYGVKSICSIESAQNGTKGRIRMSSDAIARQAAARRELNDLEDAVRKANRRN